MTEIDVLCDTSGLLALRSYVHHEAMAIVPFPKRQAPYFADVKSVIDFARSMDNVGILSEEHRLELIKLVMESEDAASPEAIHALANLFGQHGEK